MEHIFSLIMNFPSAQRLARVIRSRGKSESILSIAEVIYSQHLQGLDPFRGAVRFYLDVCYTIDKIKIRTIGVNAPTDVSNAVQLAVGSLLAKHSRWDNADLDWLGISFESFRANSDFLTEWGFVKLRILHNTMQHLRATRELSGSLNLPTSIIESAESQYDSVEVHIAEVMAQLLDLRRYGVKSSFTQNGFLPSSNAAWVMWDYRDFQQMLGGLYAKDRIAVVSLSTAADQIKDIRPERIEPNGSSSGVVLNFPASFFWSLDTSAELKVSLNNDHLSVREIFEKDSKSIQYQALRLQLLYHLYDLVVPVAKLATLPTTQGIKQGRLSKLVGLLSGSKKDPVVDLILPRIKLLEDRQSLHEAAEREVEDSETSTLRRSVRRHGVTDFIRPLPKGHKPSARARQLAFEAFGIVLSENETYVRRHSRGNGDVITAHRVIRSQ